MLAFWALLPGEGLGTRHFQALIEAHYCQSGSVVQFYPPHFTEGQIKDQWGSIAGTGAQSLNFRVLKLEIKVCPFHTRSHFFSPSSKYFEKIRIKWKIWCKSKGSEQNTIQNPHEIWSLTLFIKLLKTGSSDWLTLGWNSIFSYPWQFFTIVLEYVTSK